MSVARRARLRALAKINLDLRVLGKRDDGYHELRTIFQTISLADTIEIAFTPGRKTAIKLHDPAAIPDNLVERAARAVMDAARTTGRVEIRLHKRIPMGAGLGGGSSDAAAILLALPVLAGRALPPAELSGIGQSLGSDVPFFLLGGAAVGIGRGTELFPLPDSPAHAALLVAPSVHVSTPEAYRRLGERLTHASRDTKIHDFQSHAWNLQNWDTAGNDFEEVVFEQHPGLASLKKGLIRLGAEVAMMTGSGSAVFGLFQSGAAAARALAELGERNAFRVSLVSRARYRTLWHRTLAEHTIGRVWPPQSRYLR
jgi:4-diphosphocytidyl-2-C-methyl-D-erythritol kinase